MKVVPENNWETYSYRTDDGPVFVGFHTDADKMDQASLPYCARVIIPIKSPNHNGGPERPEAEVIWGIEDSLAAALEADSVPCQMLGRLTHSGRRELVFQVHDWESFRPPVGKWIMEHDAYDIDVSEHDGWDFFHASVWPTHTSWMLISDRRVVDSLLESGSDPSKPHSLEFVFLGDNDGLEKMRSFLLDRGYTLLAWTPEEKRLIMAKCMPLDLGLISKESLLHDEECERLGIEYDGWGCLAVK